MSGHSDASRNTRELNWDRNSAYIVGGTKGGKEEIKEKAAKEEGGEEGIKEDAAQKEGADAALNGYKATREDRRGVIGGLDMHAENLRSRSKREAASSSDEPLKSSDLEPDKNLMKECEEHLASKPAKMRALASKKGDREAGAK